MQHLARRAADLRIGTKIIGAAVAGSMIFAALGAVGQVRLRGLASEQDRAYGTKVQALDQMTTIRSAIGGQQEAVLSFILSDPGPYRATYADAISETDRTLDEGLSALMSIQLSEVERSGLREVSSDVALWRKSRNVALDAAVGGEDPQGVVYLIVRLGTVAHVVKQSANDLLELLMNAVSAGAKRAAESSERTAQLMLLLGLGSAVAALALSTLVARSLSRPLAEVVDVVVRAASGDLSRKVTFRRKDEIGRMGDALNETLGILQRTFDDVHHRATHDSLTGLANRALLRERLEEADARTGTGQSYAIVLLDLDHFKQVNDIHGHAAGDHVLVITAQRILHTVSQADTVARLGGDEFAVLLSETSIGDDVQCIVDALNEALEQATQFGGQSLIPRVSIGAAVWHVGQTTDATMHVADAMLYTAKATRGGLPLPQQRGRAGVLSAALAEALGKGQLEVVYQPLIGLIDRRPVGVEALLRWRHPSLGTISPVEFIPIAETDGYIYEIGLWVLEQSCRQVRRWQLETLDGAELYASVNLSPVQLQNPSLVDDVFAVLTRTGLAARHLTLEVTESAMINEAEAVLVLTALRMRGIRIAIDDFGSGYSSMRYLTSLPIDVVKIDRSLTAGLNGTPERAIIIESVVRLGRALHFSIVVEGVECAQQADELQSLGCQVGQGFFWARPLSVGTAGDVLSSLSQSVVTT